MWKWWFNLDQSVRLMGQMGLFGSKAKKEANEVATAQLIVAIMILIVGSLIGLAYLLLNLI